MVSLVSGTALLRYVFRSLIIYQTYRHTYRQTQTDRHRQTDRQTDRQTHWSSTALLRYVLRSLIIYQTYRHTYRQTQTHTYRQTDRQTDRQRHWSRHAQSTTLHSYTYLKFKFREFSRRKRVIFQGVFQELYMQNFTRLLHTFFNCMCRPTDNQQKMHKNTLTNDAMAKQRLTEQSQIVPQ